MNAKPKYPLDASGAHHKLSFISADFQFTDLLLTGDFNLTSETVFIVIY